MRFRTAALLFAIQISNAQAHSLNGQPCASDAAGLSADFTAMSAGGAGGFGGSFGGGSMFSAPAAAPAYTPPPPPPMPKLVAAGKMPGDGMNKISVRDRLSFEPGRGIVRNPASYTSADVTRIRKSTTESPKPFAASEVLDSGM